MFMKSLKTRDLALMAIFLCLDIIISSYFIRIAPNLRIYFSFIIKMIFACMFPIKFAIIYGFASDSLGYLLHPSGAYFIGYLLSSIMASFLYSLFLYPKVNIKNIILAKTSVNLIVHCGLNSLWTLITYSKGRTFIEILYVSITKNLILLPFEIIIFYLVYKLLANKINQYRYTSK